VQIPLSAPLFTLFLNFLCFSQYSDGTVSEDSSLAGCNAKGSSDRQIKKSLLDPDDKVSVFLANIGSKLETGSKEQISGNIPL
jgi:hypothetical protein